MHKLVSKPPPPQEWQRPVNTTIGGRKGRMANLMENSTIVVGGIVGEKSGLKSLLSAFHQKIAILEGVAIQRIRHSDALAFFSQLTHPFPGPRT